MPRIDRPTMPPAVQAALQRPWVQEAIVDASHPDVPSGQHLREAQLGNLITRQPRFRFVPNADTGRAELAPETAAAERLARSPRGDALLAIIRGVRELEPAARITGVALSTSNNGAAANTVLNDLEAPAGAPLPRGDSDAQLERFQEHVDGASSLRWGGMGSEYDLASGWILLGPEHSSQLLQAAGLPVAAAHRGVIDGEQGVADAHVAAHASVVLAHEAAHAVTPPTADEFTRGAWLEEATANLMVNLPSSRERIREAMGVDVGPRGRQAWHRREDARSLTGESDVRQRSVRDHYPHETALLAKVLERAGLDVTRAGDEAKVRALLQDAAPGAVPDALARQIGRAAGVTDAGTHATIRSAIERGDATTVAAIDEALA